MRAGRWILLFFALGATARGQEPAPWEVGSYDPPWAARPARRTFPLEYDRRASAEANGERLYEAMSALRPGDTLVVAGGTWSIARRTNLVLVGTAEAPIRIVAAKGETPVLTRPDAAQNVLNLGEDDRVRTEYVLFAGLEFTGGSSLLRIHACSNVWIDRCEFHHGGAEGITANTRDTDHLYLTRNHIHHFEAPGATGEGMYLGANDGKVAMSWSVVAANHVHDTGGEQGDGIELKQGSHGVWIVENHVHDTHYPAILVYGTGGKGVNVVERNVLYRSGDNTLQVQGEAIVRNNLVVGGATALASTDHQGKTRDLVVVHNTIVHRELAVNLSSWNGRDGLVFANNAVYSEGTAIRFPEGSAGVTFAGNVVFGAVEGVPDEGRKGRGLADFRDLSWDGERRDATPAPGSALLGAGDRTWLVPTDLEGGRRRALAAGAVRGR